MPRPERSAPWYGVALAAVFTGALLVARCLPGHAVIRLHLTEVLFGLRVVLLFGSLGWMWPVLWARDPRYANHASVWLWPKVYALGASLVVLLPALDMLTNPNAEPLREALVRAVGNPRVRVWLPSFGIVCSFLGALHGMGLLTVHAKLCVEREGLRRSSPESLREQVERYRALREQLQRFMGCLGAIVGVVTLESSALRHLILSAAVRQDVFPAAYVLGLGLYYTFLLGAWVVPAQQAALLLGRELADRLVRPAPADLPASGEWKGWLEEQRAVETYLGTSQNPLQALQASLAVLTPLIASVSTLVLSGG